MLAGLCLTDHTQLRGVAATNKLKLLVVVLFNRDQFVLGAFLGGVPCARASKPGRVFSLLLRG